MLPVSELGSWKIRKEPHHTDEKENSDKEKVLEEKVQGHVFAKGARSFIVFACILCFPRVICLFRKCFVFSASVLKFPQVIYVFPDDFRIRGVIFRK